jgi:hypothetical protein
MKSRQDERIDAGRESVRRRLAGSGEHEDIDPRKGRDERLRDEEIAAHVPEAAGVVRIQGDTSREIDVVDVRQG